MEGREERTSPLARKHAKTRVGGPNLKKARKTTQRTPARPARACSFFSSSYLVDDAFLFLPTSSPSIILGRGKRT